MEVTHACTHILRLLGCDWLGALPTRLSHNPTLRIRSRWSLPYAAGGPANSIAQIVAERMRLSLGQPLIIENVTGAGGSLGTGRVARAAGDGYTIMIGNWSTHTANGVLSRCRDDVQKDFEPDFAARKRVLLIVARRDLPANTLGEFVAWLKANAGKALAGTSGVGSPSHVAALLFQKEIGAPLRVRSLSWSQSRGSGPPRRSGSDMMITAPSVVLPHLRAGTIKAHAVTSRTRLETAPENSDHRRSWIAWLLRDGLAGALRAERHRARHPHKTLRGGA